MSIQAVAWVLDNSEATGQTRMCFIALANHADKFGGSIFPSMLSAAEDAKCSERTMQRAAKELVELGELVEYPEGSEPEAWFKIRKDRRPRCYLIPQMAAGRHVVTPSEPRGDTGDADGVTPVSPEPSFNHSVPTSSGSGDRAAPDPTDAEKQEIVKATLGEYERRRRKAKANLPPPSALRQRAGELASHPAKAFTPSQAAAFMLAEAAGEPTTAIWAAAANREEAA